MSSYICCVNLGDYDLVILDDENAKGGRVKHVRIRKRDDSGEYFITEGRTFETVPALISNYKRKSFPSCHPRTFLQKFNEYYNLN